MVNYAVVIPSKNAVNLAACVKAIRENDQPDRIIVVDDGLAGVPPGMTVLPGVKPFVFARNVNIGMREAFTGGAEVAILLNDDALLKSTNGFSAMAAIAAIGIVGSRGSVMDHRTIPFWCVAIARNVWETVGELDERFVHYGFDDNDYCRRALDAGIPLNSCNACVMDHESLSCTFSRDCKPNAVIYAAKWAGKLYPAEVGFMRNIGVTV